MGSVYNFIASLDVFRSSSHLHSLLFALHFRYSSVNFTFITLLVNSFCIRPVLQFLTLHFNHLFEYFLASQQPYPSRCIPKLFSSHFSRLSPRLGKLIELHESICCTHYSFSFGQEQGNGAITAIGALTDLGTSGQAATLAGGSIQFLLAAANPCGSK
jgi:hypothetical protein